MSFLWTVARILVKNAANSLGLGLGDSAVEIWEAWHLETPSTEKKMAEVQEVAQLSPSEAGELAKKIVLELAADQPNTLRDQVAAVLAQVPEATRRSLRRPEDPSGTSLRPGSAIDGPESVSVLLPTHLPRFKAGDTPSGVGDWELVDLLGVGGFGEVWKARNPFLDGAPFVALKFCTDKEAAQTLRHEAGVLNQVMQQGTHSGIVRLLHTYLRVDPPCLEYEYVAGGDLAGVIRDWHRGEAVFLDRINQTLLQLAEIVGFAHRLTPPVVHRDLKPANVLVQRDPGGGLQLKVTDFGIGGIAAGQAMKGSTQKPAWHLTALATGTCTPLYASPQQAAGKPPDTRDDVFALGVLWHQMLTGHLAAGRPGGSGWKKRLTGQGAKGDLVELLESCFEDEPDHRPKDAAELAERLKAVVGGAPARPEADDNHTHQAVKVWARFLRKEIPPLFGLAFRKAAWHVGYVRCDKLIFLLVTLEKDGADTRFQYKDHFLGPDLFQWQSQNRTKSDSQAGQALSRHQELGYTVHLFIRATKKRKGMAVPFVYCGEVSFVEWENEAPITIRWRLAHAVPNQLWEELQVPG